MIRIAAGIASALPLAVLIAHATALYPVAWVERPISGWQAGAGRIYTAPLDTMWMSRQVVGESPATVLENGVALPCPNTPVATAIEQGGGRYAVSDGLVYASATDDSDLRANGRTYLLRWPAPPPAWLVLGAIALAAASLAWSLKPAWRSIVALVRQPPLVLPCAVFLALVAVHRLWFFLDVPLPGVQTDSMTYFAVAEDLTSGRWPRVEVRPPVFPLVMAVVLGITRSLVALTAVQSALTAAAGLIMIAGAHRLRPWMSLPVALAMSGFAMDYWTLEYDTSALSESVYVSAMVAGLALFVCAIAARSRVALAASSATLALSIMARPAGLFLVVPWAIAVLFFLRNRRMADALAFGAPFVILLLTLATYNFARAGVFAITAWGEANLSVATFTMWEPSPAYPPEINQKIETIVRHVNLTDRDRETIDRSWSPADLSQVFLKSFNLAALNEAMRLGGQGDYVASREWIRRIGLDAIWSHKRTYAKFVWANAYMYYVTNIRWRADFDNMIKFRAKNLLTFAGEREQKADALSDRLIAPHFDRSRGFGVIVSDACSGPDVVGTIVPTTGRRLYRMAQGARNFVFSRPVWPALALLVLIAATIRLLTTRFRHEGSLVLVVIGLCPIGAGMIVSLVEWAAHRYSYTTEFSYFTVVALAPLLWNIHGSMGSRSSKGSKSVEPLRVLMITGAYHPEISSGGVQCRNMARLLAGRAQVQVLTTAVDRRLPRYATIDDVPVARVRVDVTSPWSRLRATARILIELFRLVPRAGIVHLHGFSTKNVFVTTVARLFNKPIVLSLHTSGFDEPDAIKTHGALAWWAFRQADLYLSVSPNLVDAYLAAGLPPERIEEIPNGIDLDHFAPAAPAERSAIRARLNLPGGRPLILFVGFFSKDKQPRVLFDAWLQMQEAGSPPTTLVFVGATSSPYFEVDRDLADRMQREADARGAGDRVVFTGPRHDVHDYFRAADVFALPSRREGLPVALLEAMACGLPCAASRLAGSTDTIIEHDVSGVLVPPGDVGALAQAIGGLLRDSPRAAALGAAARATIADRFSSADVADRWLEAYVRIRGSDGSNGSRGSKGLVL